MKFIIDAQLPAKLKTWINSQGHDALHTNDMPLKELTPDIDIIKFSEQENRIVVTKDSDFFKYYIVHGIPKKILIISTGNITNKTLLELFERNFGTMETYFNNGNNIIEIDNNTITVHS